MGNASPSPSSTKLLSQLVRQNMYTYYIGLSTNTFKSRYATHKYTFDHRHVQGTGLSEHIRKLTDQGTDYNIKWSIEAFAPAYSQNTSKCQLCLTEKMMIMRSMKSKQHSSLNKRSEFFSKCIHRKFVLLNRVKIWNQVFFKKIIFQSFYTYLSFLASLSDSIKTKISPSLTGPLTFLIKVRDLSSINSTFTCVTPPRDPVLPIILETLANFSDWFYFNF